MAGIALQPFDGAPPADETLRRVLALNSDNYLYLTATLALERWREEMAPPRQQTDDGPHLVFHKALRLLMGRPHLSRTDERVALLRAAQEIARADPGLGAQLRHDVSSLLEALADLAGQGIHLEGTLPADLAGRFALSRPGITG